jgi:hypothetical protein
MIDVDKQATGFVFEALARKAALIAEAEELRKARHANEAECASLHDQLDLCQRITDDPDTHDPERDVPVADVLQGVITDALRLDAELKANDESWRLWHAKREAFEAWALGQAALLDDDCKALDVQLDPKAIAARVEPTGRPC